MLFQSVLNFHIFSSGQKPALRASQVTRVARILPPLRKILQPLLEGAKGQMDARAKTMCGGALVDRV